MSNRAENIDVTKDIVAIEKTARELSNRAKEIKVVTTEEIEVKSRKTLGLFGKGKADALDTQEGFSTINTIIIDTNNSLIDLNNIVQEIPKFLEGLSKNQLQKIAISQKTANSALNELGEQYEVLKKFKVKIDKLEHLTSIDNMYSDLTLQNESIESIQIMIEEIQLKNTELEKLIDGQNSKIDQKLKDFDRSLENHKELLNKIQADNKEFKTEISELLTNEQEEINQEIQKSRSEVTQQLIEQKTEIELKNSELQKQVKHSYYLSGISILLIIITYILSILGVI